MTREEAIQWLTDIKENITENWSHDVAIDMAIEALSAESVHGWIPVSERLPNEDDEYLVARGEFIYVYSYGIPLMPMNERNRRRGWYESTSEGEFYMDVDAWMPLPEPYREDGEA